MHAIISDCGHQDGLTSRYRREREAPLDPVSQAVSPVYSRRSNAAPAQNLIQHFISRHSSISEVDVLLLSIAPADVLLREKKPDVLLREKALPVSSLTQSAGLTMRGSR